MASIVRYSTASTPNPITDYRPFVNTPDFENLPNTLVNPDLTAVVNQPLRYWKHVNGTVQLMTQGERDAVDAAIAAARLADAKLGAKNIIDGLPGYQLRGLCKLLIDEINALRQRDVDRSADVAAAISLADLKTRWAARSALNDRTLAQAKAAYKALMDGNGLDE